MYAIRVIRNYYGPRTVKSYLLSDDPRSDARAEYRTRAEALARIEQLDQAVYYTDHNESGRAEYRVVRL